MSDTIKIGNIGFNKEVLKGLSLTEAYDRFSHIRKDVVKEAHRQANPKKSKKTASKKSVDKTEE